MKAGSHENKWRGRIIRFAPLLIWIGVILLLGSGQGSMNRTSLLVRPLLEFFFPTADEFTLQLYHGYIRKLAHFLEYAVLALLSVRAFYGPRYRFVLAIGVVIFIAVSDELIQTQIGSRSGSVRDVLLDISGGLAAMAAWYFWPRRGT